MNQFIAVCAYTVMTFHHVFSRIFIEMIVKSFPPVFRMFTFQQRHKRYTLNIGRYLCSRQFEESRCIVNVLNHFGDVTSAVESFRQTHDKRCTHRFFVHETFVKPTVFAHIESLIGSVDYKCVIQ